MENGDNVKVVPEDSMSNLMLGLGMYRVQTEPISPKGGRKAHAEQFLPVGLKDRQRTSSVDIDGYYEAPGKVKHQDDMAVPDRDKKNKRIFKDLLKDEIRNIRDPKYYGRAKPDDELPVRDDAGDT
jgi:hypothetical protein